MSMHPTTNYFKNYPNRVFVETGTYTGDAIQLAINAGFSEIHSIDINPRAGDRFTGRKDIRIHQGDSAEMLWAIIRFINEPITFWLDSHWQMLEGEDPGKNPWPLLDELAQIAQHPIKNHTIMIDDMWVLTHPGVTGWSRAVIEVELLRINPSYKLEYLSNPVIDSILVAHV